MSYSYIITDGSDMQRKIEIKVKKENRVRTRFQILKAKME